jgi:hypothetical protein
MVDYTTISIPRPLAERLKEKLKGTSFNTLSNYTTYILRMILLSADMKGSRAFSHEDEEELKTRLRAMGYI